MATNIEKSMGAGGLSELADSADEPNIEIEIINEDEPVVAEVEIELEDEHNKNLAEDMSEDDLLSISTELLELVDSDERARQDWKNTYLEGLELLGLKYEQRSQPWANACGAYHPMLTKAVVKFQSEAITETFPAMGPVKTVIKGKETKEKLAAAARVAADMNYKLTDDMEEYRSEHEKLLWALPIAGAAFKKIYEDPLLGRQTAVFVPAEDVLIPFGASSIDTAERVTHIMRKPLNDVKKLMKSGFYREVDLDNPPDVVEDSEKVKHSLETDASSPANDDRLRLFEIQLDYDMPGYEDPDGIGRPYIVTIDKNSSKILGIRRNTLEGDELQLRRRHFVQYNYVPGFGAYGYGLLHLIGGFAKSATSLLRQLVDAGTLSNLPGGYKARGMRIKGDNSPIAPGEFRDVDVPAGTLKENIMPLPFKEPSQTLFNLLGEIINEGESFINSSELNVSDMSANAPVGTTLALLERQLKVMSAIQARLHASMKQEFKLLKGLIADGLSGEYEYDVDNADRAVKREDYDMVEVVPVSDPNASTMAHRVIRWQTVAQLAQQSPGVYDLSQLHRSMVEEIGIKNAEKLVPIEEDIKNTDPITENQRIIMAQPVKAYLIQDHQAHIAVHMSAMEDPKIQGLMQNNPNAPALMAQMHAHIAAHIAYEYRKQMEQQMGITLPPEEDEMPPEMEVSVSRMAAVAGQQLLQKNQAEVAQQQAAEQAQDPLVQLQQKETEQRDRELDIKERAAQVDAAFKADQIELKEKELAARVDMHDTQLQAKATADIVKMANENEREEDNASRDDIHRAVDREDTQAREKNKAKPEKE